MDTQNRVRILKGDLKGFQEKFKTKDRIPSAVSGQYGENTARSRNQSDWRICRIPPAHELRKKLKMIFSHLKGAKKKKIKIWLKRSRNCSVYVRITFDEMESSFAGFNHVCFQFRRGISSKVLS